MNLIYILSIIITSLESTQIGLKPDNLILCDLGKYQNSLFLAEAYGETSTVSGNGIKTEKPNYSWVLTEPLFGAIGGFLGFSLLVLATENVDAEPFWEGGPGMILLPAAISSGVSLGVWSSGRFIENEKGSFMAALLGAIIGSVVALPLGDNYWIGSIVGGVIFYRVSLK